MIRASMKAHGVCGHALHDVTSRHKSHGEEGFSFASGQASEVAVLSGGLPGVVERQRPRRHRRARVVKVFFAVATSTCLGSRLR